MFTVTDKAKVKIQETLGRSQGQFVRLYLQGMG